MFLHLLAPFRSRLNFKTERTVLHQKSYDAFRSEVAKTLSDEASDSHLNLIPTENVSTAREMRFETLSEVGTLFRNPYAFIFHINSNKTANTLLQLAKQADKELGTSFRDEIRGVPDSLDVHVGDNHLALAELRLAMDPSLWQRGAEELSAELDRWTSRLLYLAVDHYYTSAIHLLIERIYSEPIPEGDFFLNKNDFILGREFGNVLWVNRTLLCERPETASDPQVHRWLGAPRHKLSLKEDSVHLGWGNNLAIGLGEQSPLDDALFSLRLAQFYYSYFDRFIENSRYLIARGQAAQTWEEIEEALEILESELSQALFTVSELPQSTLELQGMRKHYFEKLLERWEFDSLVDIVEKKASACRETIEMLNRKRERFIQDIGGQEMRKIARADYDKPGLHSWLYINGFILFLIFLLVFLRLTLWPTRIPSAGELFESIRAYFAVVFL